MNRGSFKDTLIGKEGRENKDSSTLKNDDDFKLLDGDIITGKEDGMPLIQFSNCIHQILRKSMALSVIVKLLGRKIRQLKRSMDRGCLLRAKNGEMTRILK
ncbi:hypothetical protein Golob_006344 [Gossypium lobatum]|uniref:Uncharacterized protein n=1 Tax=Gossypium lobatum TaxID=34289 RepID=A0A7J8MVX9_9ROSI|nr:hypothetical protein [Gossypium lobatum]